MFSSLECQVMEGFQWPFEATQLPTEVEVDQYLPGFCTKQPQVPSITWHPSELNIAQFGEQAGERGWCGG